MNKLRINLGSAKVYFKDVTYVTLLSILFISIIFQFSFREILLFSFLLLIVDFLLLYRLGASKRTELEQLKTILNSIRKNEYISPDEIKLGRNLYEIEGAIKAMFLRTQNDIINLKKLEQVRTEFLGNVSHELRTPIFAIQGYLETLLNGAISDERVNRGFLEKAARHTENLNNLLNDLIDISMIESGQMRMSFRYFNIKEYLTELVEEFRPFAEEKGLELKVGSIKNNLQVFGDKKKLRQVLVNLLSNALKYTEEGGVEVLVEEEENKTARIIVKDTGFGLSEEDQLRIFERFYRVDKDRSRAVGGTGLGLAIVKHIIEAHESKISVKSVLGKGSEFSFALKK
ncbi:MAG: two-component sensor histidine kinase [Melioribacteraceae bacterium]|nr:MAG: two-component sensor histidine kinase [Melioribacteraceae bacterium]